MHQHNGFEYLRIANRLRNNFLSHRFFYSNNSKDNLPSFFKCVQIFKLRCSEQITPAASCGNQMLRCLNINFLVINMAHHGDYRVPLPGFEPWFQSVVGRIVNPLYSRDNRNLALSTATRPSAALPIVVLFFWNGAQNLRSSVRYSPQMPQHIVPRTPST